MAQAAILFPSTARKILSTSEAWLRRAAQARRVGTMLMAPDAALLEAYARECEAEAARPADQRPAIAA
jgi:hypothetical protein